MHYATYRHHLRAGPRIGFTEPVNISPSVSYFTGTGWYRFNWRMR